MKFSDLENADQIVTKDFLAATKSDLLTKLAELKTDLILQIVASERAQRIWIWGLYALVIASFFIRHK
jgi:hypothetical protein